MSKVNFTVNAQKHSAEEGSNLLAALVDVGIYVPHLCFGESAGGACRLCFVEVAGAPRPLCACEVKVADGLSVSTESEAARELARRSFELIAAQHAIDCQDCYRDGNCMIKKARHHLNARFGMAGKAEPAPEADGVAIRADKCILCGRCIAACATQGNATLGFVGRGQATVVEPVVMDAAQAELCRGCRACMEACPAGAVALG